MMQSFLRATLSNWCLFIYLFICYLHNLMPLVEYAKKKNSINPQNILFEIYLFIYVIIIFYTNFGFYI
jgi:hypothetical protein